MQYKPKWRKKKIVTLTTNKHVFLLNTDHNSSTCHKCIVYCNFNIFFTLLFSLGSARFFCFWKRALIWKLVSATEYNNNNKDICDFLSYNSEKIEIQIQNTDFFPELWVYILQFWEKTVVINSYLLEKNQNCAIQRFNSLFYFLSHSKNKLPYSYVRFIYLLAYLFFYQK